MTLGPEKSLVHESSPSESVKNGASDDTIEKLRQAEAISFLQPTFAPKMMSLAKFLEPFDKTAMTDEDAAQKYSVYVAGYLKEQLADHFERHKNSAWFRDKYHPDNMSQKDAMVNAIRSRFEVFVEMRRNGFFDGISLDYINRATVEKLLDQFAIKLAGGTVEDLSELDAFDPKSLEPKKTPVKKKVQVDKPTDNHSPENSRGKRQVNEDFKVSPKGDNAEPKQHDGKDIDSDVSTSCASSSSSAASSSSATSASSSSASSSSRSSVSSGSRSSSAASSSLSASSFRSGSSSRSAKKHKQKKKGATNVHRKKGKKSNKSRRKTMVEETVAKDTDEAQECTKSMGVGDSEHEKYDEENRSPPPKPLRPPPIHVTRVVYLPYLPLTVHRATLATLLGEHPEFLRVSVLDPTPIPHPPDTIDRPPLAVAPQTTSLVLHRPAWLTFSAARSTNTSPSETPLVFCHRLAERLRSSQADSTKEASDLAIALSASRLLPSPLARDRVKASTRLSTCCQAAADVSLNPVCTRSVARRHLVMAAKLVGRLDEVSGLWRQANGDTLETGYDWSIPRPEEFDPMDNLIGASTDLADLSVRNLNPLLENLTDHLVDECSPEEEESVLLYGDAPQKPKDKVAAAESLKPADADLLRALDALLLYLRLVYSIDFYSPALYPWENDMPHPCGIIHVRPFVSNTTKTLRLPSPPRLVFSKVQRSLEAAHRVFARQLCRVFRLVTPLRVGTLANIRETFDPLTSVAPTPTATTGDSTADPEKAAQTGGQHVVENDREMDENERRLRMLGYRDVGEVVEAFIKANTKRKRRKVDIIWVCPLSDKKFRGPAFVRKHILNKHAEKVEEEKKENADFFNNFLLDQTRPELLKPPRRRLPALKKTKSTRKSQRNRSSQGAMEKSKIGDTALSDSDADKSDRSPIPWRRRSGGGGGGRGGFMTSPPSSHANTRYWHNRGGPRGYQGNWEGPRRGGGGGSGYSNPWGSYDRRRGGGSGFYRTDGNRGENNYVDLDAPR